MNAKTRTYAVRPDGPGFVPGKLIEYSGQAKSSTAVTKTRALLKRKPRARRNAPQPGNKSALTAGGSLPEAPGRSEKSGRLSFITGGLISLYTRMNQHWISKGGGNNRDVGSRSKPSP